MDAVLPPSQMVFLIWAEMLSLVLTTFIQAYAKFYGSYANIEGGVSLDAGVDFTGLPLRSWS